MDCESSAKYPPQTFLDLVDDCLLICEDRFHDETWDTLVKNWAVKLRNEAYENGTLFTRKWEDEEIPDFFLKKQLMKGEKLSKKQQRRPRVSKKEYLKEA